MEMTAEARIQHVIDARPSWYIPFPQAERILQIIVRTLRAAPSSRPRHLLLQGESNAGKTQLINQALTALYGSADPEWLRLSTPALMLECTARMDEPGFYDEVLLKLNSPFNPRSPVAVKKASTLAVLRGLQKKKLIIDELHNLLAQSPLKQQQTLMLLRALSNDREMQLHYIAAGTRSASVAINALPEMSNRFRIVEVPRLGPDAQFQQVLKSFVPLLPLKTESRLHEPAMANRLFQMCEGLVGDLALILEDATIDAIESGDERITSALLDRLSWRSPAERAIAAAQDAELAAIAAAN